VPQNVDAGLDVRPPRRAPHDDLHLLLRKRLPSPIAQDASATQMSRRRFHLLADVRCKAIHVRVTKGLKVGDEMRCPECRRWHLVIRWHTSGTDYTLKMLYFRCDGKMFYAGQEGLESRHESRHGSNQK